MQEEHKFFPGAFTLQAIYMYSGKSENNTHLNTIKARGHVWQGCKKHQLSQDSG